MFLLQILMLRLAAVMVAGMLVRKGSEVTLTCDLSWSGVGRECNGITWTFGGIGAPLSVEVVHLGKVQRDGLVLVADCSLVIKSVTAQNAGNYECARYRIDPGRPGEDVLEGRSSVNLYVVTVEERRDEKEEKFNCTVSSFDPGGCRVRWNLGAMKVDKDNQQIKRTEGLCYATLSIPRSHFLLRSDIPTCEVTDRRSGNITVFRVSGTPTTTSHPKKTTRKPEPDSSTEPTTEPTTGTQANPTRLGDLWWLLLLVALVGLVVVVLLVVRWRRTKGGTFPGEPSGTGTKGGPFPGEPSGTGTKGGTGENTAEAEDDISYSSISYTGKTRREPPVRGRDDGDAVTYSTVKTTSCPADPNILYSTINFQTRK